MSYSSKHLNNGQRLLCEMVEHLTKKDIDIPDEVSNFILGEDLLKHAQLDVDPTPMDEDILEDFVSQFEDFVVSHPDEETVPTTARRTISENFVNRLNSVTKSKNEERIQTIRLFKKLLETKTTFQSKFEEGANLHEVETALLEKKEEFLEARVLQSVLNRTPVSLKAFKILNEYVREENIKLTRQSILLEEKAVKYKDVEDSAEYNTLLAQWKDLQKRKQVLVQNINN